MCGSQSPWAAHASQSANVSSYLDTANALAIATWCGGPSLVCPPFSSGADPMVKEPAGTTTISGQSAVHSLKESPGFSACSAAVVNTCGRTCETMYSRMAV